MSYRPSRICSRATKPPPAAGSAVLCRFPKLTHSGVQSEPFPALLSRLVLHVDGRIRFVHDFRAKEGLDNVFHGGDARRAAVTINDEGDMFVLLVKIVKQLKNTVGFRHNFPHAATVKVLIEVIGKKWLAICQRSSPSKFSTGRLGRPC